MYMSMMQENTVYDIEMQTTRQKDLPKRTRYYQGMIDLNLIQKDMRYSELKKSYVNFYLSGRCIWQKICLYIHLTIFVSRIIL